MTDRVIIETGNGEYEILPNRALTRIRRIEPRSEPRSGLILRRLRLDARLTVMVLE